jgi:internalin A
MLFILGSSCGSSNNNQEKKHQSIAIVNIQLDLKTIKENDAIKEPRKVRETYWDVDNLTYFLRDTSIISLRTAHGIFSDLTPLRELPSLEILEIRNNSNLFDITPLSTLKNLRVLYLTRCKNINNIEPLSELYNLQALNLSESYMNNTTDLAEISNLKSLEEFRMIVGNITSLESISKLINLRILDLDLTSLKDDSMTKLQNLNKLNRLRLCGVRYNDSIYEDTVIPTFYTDWLIKLVNLESITLEGFKIINIGQLSNLPNLRYVGIERSTFDDLKSLIKSKTINMISLDSGQLSYDEKQLFIDEGIKIISNHDD